MHVDLRRPSANLHCTAASSVQPSYLRPTYVLPGRTAQAGDLSALFAIRPTVLPESRVRRRARTHTHTRAPENLGRTVGRLDGFMASTGFGAVTDSDRRDQA